MQAQQKQNCIRDHSVSNSNVLLCNLLSLSENSRRVKPHVILNKLCARPHDMPLPLYAACCSPAPAHTRLTSAAPSAPSAMNIHDRQAAARSGYDYRVVHINYVVIWTANQSGLVTLTFHLLTLKVVSESCVTWATSVPILVFLALSVLELGPMYATDVRQTDVRQTDVRRQITVSLNASAH